MRIGRAFSNMWSTRADGIIQGDGSDATGNGDVINLTHEQVRTLVFIYRGGGFDRKLQAVGMETAV